MNPSPGDIDNQLPPLTVSALEQSVAGTAFHTVTVVNTTGSTNADLIARAHTGHDIVGQVLVAEHQSAGRGRHARRWQSPPRAQISMSLAVRITEGTPGDAFGWLPLLAGLAVTDALAGIGARAELKWPNDVHIDGLKVAGILAELAPEADGGVAVIGIGVNTGLTPDQLPVDTATSLQLVTERPVDRTALTAAIITALDARLAKWPGRLDALASDYRRCSATLGRQVRVQLPADGEILGRADDIDDAGRLLIRQQSGCTLTVAAGDVTHLRPVDID